MQSNNIEYKAIDAIGTIVYIAVNGQYMGNIVVSDELKTDAKGCCGAERLRRENLDHAYRDTRKVGEQVAGTGFG